MASITTSQVLASFYASIPSAEDISDDEARARATDALARMAQIHLQEIRTQEDRFAGASDRKAKEAEEAMTELDPFLLRPEDDPVPAENDANLFTGAA